MKCLGGGVCLFVGLEEQDIDICEVCERECERVVSEKDCECVRERGRERRIVGVKSFEDKNKAKNKKRRREKGEEK